MAKTIDLQFPSGVSRRLGLRASSRGGQREYPAPWSWNVRLEDSLATRLRGGSFTGISAGARPSEIRYKDRLLTFSSNAITATRMGDDTDTSLSADVSDLMRPALVQLSYGGVTGGDVVALIPHKDSYLLCFTADETWIQNADMYTGSRHRVSDEVGIIGADAWCVAHDTVYFLSSHGLHSIGADGSGLKPLSEDVIPDDLTGVTDSSCTLTYQHSDRGVYIHKTGTNWFYDIAREQFWPFDTSTGDSHVLIGPVRLGGGDRLGIIQTMHGIMAEGSATVDWRIVHGDTAEEAAANGKSGIEAALAGTSYASYIRASGSWEAGRSQTARPRVSAMYACIWLAAESDWAYEGLSLTVIPAGQWRK